MALASWLADGADPAQMNPEEVRRLANTLRVREEQAIARLESLVSEQASLVSRGAATPSPALRRALARRHGRLSEDVFDVDRDLARMGKELAGLRAIRDLLREGAPLAAPGDAKLLLTLLNDSESTEEAFAGDLAAALRAGQVKRKSRDARRSGPDLMEVWEKMDRGEISSAREALRTPQRGSPGSGTVSGTGSGKVGEKKSEKNSGQGGSKAGS
jgi:hypothetical protein